MQRRVKGRCLYCGRRFNAKTKRRRFCDAKHRFAYWNKTHPRQMSGDGLPRRKT